MPREADLTNFGEFYRPALKRLKTGFLSAFGDAPCKTSLKRTLSHFENLDHIQ